MRLHWQTMVEWIFYTGLSNWGYRVIHKAVNYVRATFFNREELEHLPWEP